MASQLLSTFRLRDLELANRVVVSPMCQYISDNGCANDWHILQLGQFSLGGSGGLVITEATAVRPDGRITPKDLMLCNDETEAALKRVIDFCKKHGPARHAIQLAHAGRKSSTNPVGMVRLGLDEGGWETIAPSAIPFGPEWHTPRAMTKEDIRQVTDDFVSAVHRANRIGYDAIELHAAHGYLLHEFMSPISNERTDDYGGSFENRIRLTLEIFSAMRAAWPAHKPMGVRISATDWIPGGWDVDQSVALARELKALGCDFIDASSGALDYRQKIVVEKGYQVPFAERIRKEADIATIAVGLITDPQEAESIIAEGKADFICMARGAMWDPRWVWHAAEQLAADAPYASQVKLCHPSSRPWVFPRWRRDKR